MIVSMTAFGRKEDSGDWGDAAWEIKTVNHRYLEISIHLPDELLVLENQIRNLIATKIKRGKVDCILRYEANESSNPNISINNELTAKLLSALELLQIPNSQAVNPMENLRWAGVIKKETLDPDKIGEPILELLDSALDTLVDTREREGEKIYGMIKERCESVDQHVAQIRTELPTLMDTIRNRIVKRAKELSVDLDNDRLEQEMIILAQKMDVVEELDRMDAHIGEVLRVLDGSEPVGRRLDFLMQEMNRESNTLSSKATNIEVSNTSIELKVLIEQMREQIQNIE